MPLLDFSNYIRLNGSNSDNKKSICGIRDAPKNAFSHSFCNYCLWQKCFLGWCASHDQLQAQHDNALTMIIIAQPVKDF